MQELKKKLQDEIAALEYELRNELPKEILKARAHGDLSENAEYHAAKERQGFVNARLGQLKKRLAEVSMVDMSKIPHPMISKSMERFAAMPEAERAKVRFIHLNWSNPARFKDSEARHAINHAGFHVAEENERLCL